MKGTCWSTAATGAGHADRTLDVAELSEHLHRCLHLSGRGFGWLCGAEAMQAFVRARIVTTALGLAAVATALTWWVL
jgi:hypothetical protein